MTDAQRLMLKKRLWILMIGFGAAMVLIAAKTADLQIAQHDKLKDEYDGRSHTSVKVPAKRGNIYDRNGEKLAISVDVPSIMANPMEINDPRPAAKKLSKVLGLNYERLYRQLARETQFRWIKRHVSPEVADRVMGLKIPGVGIRYEAKRFYPNREEAAQVLGFTDIDGKGLEGIERELNEHLAGKTEVVRAVKDNRGRTILESGLGLKDMARGDHVYLTLDTKIQHAAELAITRVLSEYSAVSASVVVLDVETAGVLAMATGPSFNPNKVAGSRMVHRKNRVVTDQFEPGSTMKPFIMAAALDEGVVSPSDVLFCENGRMRVGGYTIHDVKGYGDMSLTQILQKSSNICSAKIGQFLGKERIYDTYRNLGFGERTGVDFPGEVRGTLRKPKRWATIDMATASFGQGLSSNLLHLAAAYRVLAADGVYREPTLVERIEHIDGSSKRLRDIREHRVFGSDANALVVDMLEAVVSDGTGRRAAVAGYKAAGKTGTAQRPDPATKGYSKEDYWAVFGGFLPAHDPKVVITVLVDRPQPEHGGGVVAAPVFAEVGAAAMLHLKILPSEEQEPRPSASAAEAIARIHSQPAVSNEAEHQPAEVSEGQLPSFVGLTARESVGIFQSLGIAAQLELIGSGEVVKQEPKAGTENASVQKLRLVMARD